MLEGLRGVFGERSLSFIVNFCSCGFKAPRPTGFLHNLPVKGRFFLVLYKHGKSFSKRNVGDDKRIFALLQNADHRKAEKSTANRAFGLNICGSKVQNLFS